MRKAGLLVCILCLGIASGNLAAKERRGVDTIVAMTNGLEVKGELIAVRKDSLVLLTSYANIDESISISKVRSIRIAKKSNAVNGTILGLVAGGGVGVLLGVSIGEYSGFSNYSAITVAGVAGGVLVGGVVGLLVGSHTKVWETFDIEGKSPERIKMILDRLRPKGRVPDFR